MSTDQLLPTPLPPPPRQVCSRKESDLRFLRLISVGIYIAALGALAYLILVILWGKYGTNTTGHIVGTRVSHGKSTSYYIKFTYPADGLQTDEDSVPGFIYDQVQNRGINGSPDVTVRYWIIGPYHYSGLVEFSGVGAKSFLPGFMLLFFGIAAITHSWGAWLKPAREKMLVRTGTPVLGAITDKRIAKGKKSRYYMKYIYKDATGLNRETEMEVTNYGKWQALEIGQIVTVLVDGTKPNRTLVYELSRYRLDEPSQ